MVKLGAFSSCIRSLVALILIVYCSERSHALEIGIFETGPESEVALWIQGLFGLSGSTELIDPTGAIIDEDSIIEGEGFGIVRRFVSVQAALDYVEGTWQVAEESRAFGSGSYEFQISNISLEEINRAAPVLASPMPGQSIKNGRTFLFGWDYEESGEIPSSSQYFTSLSDDQIGTRYSRTSLPIPGTDPHISSGSTRVGDFTFDRTRTSIPDSGKYRYRATFEASENYLPLDVTIALGSHVQFDDKLTLIESSGELFELFGPRINFFYSRMNEPFTITLTAIPEPTTLLLSLSAAAALLQRRPVRR